MTVLETLFSEMEALKIRDIRSYDLLGRSILADTFVLSTADSITQMEAVRNRAGEVMKKAGYRLKNPNEEYEGGWLLLDFGDVIVHVFLEELRSFYNLDAIMEKGDIGAEELELLKSRA